MGKFFNGWRRKIGVVTLLMALLFMGAWVRSGFKYDTIALNGNSSRCDILSIEGRLWILFSTPGAGGSPIDWGSGDLSRLNHFRVAANGVRQRFDPQFYVDSEWRRDWAGLHFGGGMHKQVNYKPETYVTTCTFSYWYIITPLTLLSLWLFLLSKPRKSNQHKITEPIPVEGGT